MDMKIKIITIVAATAVVVGAIGAYALLNDADGDSVYVDASLAIMGNANEDSKIDQDDLDIIEEIISGETDPADHPLADANNDGDVDQEDADLLRDMIDHKSGITINVVCSNADGTPYVQDITYPLRSTVVVGTNLLSTCIQVGAADYIVGYTKTNYGVAHAPVIDNATCIGGSIFDLNTDTSITNFQNLDAQKGIDAVITMPSVSYLKTSAAYISGAGIPILRIDSSDGMDSVGGALTIGYIYGSETEKTSYEFAELSYAVLEEITERVSGLEESEKKTFMAITMGYYISQTDSAYTGVCEYAGGSTVTTLEGTGSVKINGGDEYYLNWSPDYIISFRTLDYSIDYTDISSNSTKTPQETWDQYSGYFDMMGESYENLVYINTSMPVTCRMAYIAEIFYPDLFEEGYGDSVHQQFVDNYMGYLGDFDVTKDMTTMITYADVS